MPRIRCLQSLFHFQWLQFLVLFRTIIQFGGFIFSIIILCTGHRLSIRHGEAYQNEMCDPMINRLIVCMIPWLSMLAFKFPMAIRLIVAFIRFSMSPMQWTGNEGKCEHCVDDKIACMIAMKLFGSLYLSVSLKPSHGTLESSPDLRLCFWASRFPDYPFLLT